MNITLDQLKEIAKAGYGSNRCEKMDFRFVDQKVLEYKDYILLDQHCLQWYNYLKIRVRSNVNFSIIDVSDNFNHLSAIRKMEELGLIEK